MVCGWFWLLGREPTGRCDPNSSRDCFGGNVGLWVGDRVGSLGGTSRIARWELEGGWFLFCVLIAHIAFVDNAVIN